MTKTKKQNLDRFGIRMTKTLPDGTIQRAWVRDKGGLTFAWPWRDEVVAAAKESRDKALAKGITNITYHVRPMSGLIRASESVSSKPVWVTAKAA